MSWAPNLIGDAIMIGAMGLCIVFGLLHLLID